MKRSKLFLSVFIITIFYTTMFVETTHGGVAGASLVVSLSGPNVAKLHEPTEFLGVGEIILSPLLQEELDNDQIEIIWTESIWTAENGTVDPQGLVGNELYH